ncbi:MAG: hypothetical protein U0794_22285 [Isosphaeraceae bacterium]
MLRAASSDDAAARPALAELCQLYWYPLYAYLRRQGLAPNDAEDIVQAFFARLLEDRILRYAEPGRGRFRGFLLASLRQFVIGRHQYETAAKRRPATALESLENGEGELRYSRELTDHVTPDLLFDYTWAMSLLTHAMELLEAENQEKGQSERFAAFRGVLTGQSDRSARELGAEIGMTEGAVRVAIFRLKQRYGEILREQVALTLDNDADVDDEIRVLMAALRMDRAS